MPKIFLYSNGSSKVTTRVVPLRFSRAIPKGDVIEKGYPWVDDRDVASGPTVGAMVDVEALASFRVQVKRTMLGNDAPLLALPSNQLDIDNGDVFRPPHEASFELDIKPKPSIQADLDAEVTIRWLSTHDPILGKLKVRCHTPIKLVIAFILVSTKAATESDADAKAPDPEEADLEKYLKIINAIYEPAGIVYTATVKRMIFVTSDVRDGIRAGAEMVVMFRQGKALLEKENPDDRPIMVFVINTFKSTVQGQGISPKMAEGTYLADNYGDLDGTDRMIASGAVPQGYRVRVESLKERIQNPMETHGPDNPWEVHSKEENQAKTIAEFQELLAPFGILYDPNKKIIDGFLPKGTPSALALRFFIPGIVMASNVSGSADKLEAFDYLHWGRAIAHELGHFHTLFHPGDPTYEGEVKLDDAWSRARLLYTGGRFPAKAVPPATTAGGATGTGSSTASGPAATAPASPPPVSQMDVGLGASEPGILLTNNHVVGTKLDPASGEVVAIRTAAAAWAGGK